MQFPRTLLFLLTFLVSSPVYIYGAAEADKIDQLMVRWPITPQENSALDRQIQDKANQLGLEFTFAMAADEVHRGVKRTQYEILRAAIIMEPRLRGQASSFVVNQFCNKTPQFIQATALFPVKQVTASKDKSAITLRITLQKAASKAAVIAQYQQVPGVKVTNK